MVKHKFKVALSHSRADASCRIRHIEGMWGTQQHPSKCSQQEHARVCNQAIKHFCIMYVEFSSKLYASLESRSASCGK